MKSFRFLLIFLACPVGAEFLPPAHELFLPLRADPRELQYALREAAPVSHGPLGEAAVGDYLGLYRWDLGSGKAFQVSVGGGAFGRFDLSSKTDDLESVDYYGNLPFDFRDGPWSMRFMPYHTSSHLGDDYLKRTGIVTEKHAWDNLKWLVSYEPLASALADHGPQVRELPPDLLALIGLEILRMRLTDCDALVVWSVDTTRCPVSAALMAAEKLMSSRISPIMITSGAWCRTFRSA